MRWNDICCSGKTTLGHNIPLRLVSVLVFVDLLDADFHAVLGERHVLLVQMALSAIRHVIGPEVDLHSLLAGGSFLVAKVSYFGPRPGR